MRLALGAGRMRILRQMLVESLLLAAAGGACGCVLAYLGRNAIPKMLENAWERNGLQVHFDWGIFAFTAAVTIATGVLFGLAPAIAAARANVSYGLKSAALTATRRRKGLSGRTSGRFPDSAFDFAGDQRGTLSANPGGAEVGRCGLPHRPSADGGCECAAPQVFAWGKTSHSTREWKRLSPRCRECSLSLRQKSRTSRTAVRCRTLRRRAMKTTASASPVCFTTSWVTTSLTTLRIPIMAGRGFGPQDTATSVKVGVINQSLARRALRESEPAGQAIPDQ